MGILGVTESLIGGCPPAPAKSQQEYMYIPAKCPFIVNCLNQGVPSSPGLRISWVLVTAFTPALKRPFLALSFPTFLCLFTHPLISSVGPVFAPPPRGHSLLVRSSRYHPEGTLSHHPEATICHHSRGTLCHPPRVLSATTSRALSLPQPLGHFPPLPQGQFLSPPRGHSSTTPRPLSTTTLRPLSTYRSS